MGRLHYKDDKLTFRYEVLWQEDPQSFPLSLSMPLTAREHSDHVVRPFLWGLLPDNHEVLRSWGKRFQVSDRNPFRLLKHVGEECAGAVQFVTKDRAERWLGGDAPQGVEWLDEEQVAERIRDLINDHSRSRRLGDEGQFSLAGAQAKTALFRDEKNLRWGVPKGATPTTHILKPNAGDSEGYDLNEHFCLQLARRIGIPAAESQLKMIADVPTIIVKRYDRAFVDERWMRVHQEDTCQSLARMPDTKYQNQGGPSATEIFGLIRDRSSESQTDRERFLDAMIFNFLIAGTDAHAKNFSLLLAGGGQVRLAPLYDLSSFWPYQREGEKQKTRLAMKIGGEYQHYRIGKSQWENAAREWKLDYDLIGERILRQTGRIVEVAKQVAGEVGENVGGNRGKAMLDKLVAGIGESAVATGRLFSGE